METSDSLEVAPSGRATCRTCKKKIDKGELRFGHSVPSQFSSSGHATEWHHLECAAKKMGHLVRPLLETYEGEVPNREALMSAASVKGVSAALPNADLAPTGR